LRLQLKNHYKNVPTIRDYCHARWISRCN
jgi:hypothetical protein